MEKTCKEVDRGLVPKPSKCKDPPKQRIYSQTLQILIVVLETLLNHKVHNDKKISNLRNVNENALFATLR